MRYGIPCRRALRGFLAVAAIVTLFGSGDASAQRWEWLYGSPTCVDGGLHGVKQLAGGGYVAVGESFQQPAGCGTSDAYVVVTNAAGAPVWSSSYVIGTNSRATDVLELANGDLIVVGYGLIGMPCHPGVSNDIFLLHLAGNGAIIAWNTYGGSTTTEEAWKVIQTTVGDNITTFPGDYVVAGSSTNQNAPGMRGGYLLRMNAGLGLIWDRQYGTANNDDYFYGVDEVPPQFAGAGDLVATGGSTSPPAVGTDVFTIRVNGNNATIGAPPQNESWTNLMPGAGNEVGHSVVILRNGPNAGDIVVAGYTTGAPAPSTNDEIFVFELGPDPCNQVGNVFFGDNGPFADRSYDLVEDANPMGPSDVVVTGFTNLPGGFGGSDVFLQRVATGPAMGLIGPAGIFGGTGNDEGWSVGNAVRNFPPNEAPGYIINGFTQSPNLIGAGDPQQLYLIKTDLAPSTPCGRQRAFPFQNTPNGTVCGWAIGPNIGLQCQPPIKRIVRQWGTHPCDTNVATGSRLGGGGGNDGVAGVENGASITFNGGAMTSYPNPLASGDVLNLRLDMKVAATAHVAVSDIAGRVMYRDDFGVEPGSRLVPVSTAGWRAGTYLVRVAVGAVTATSHVVVLDK